MNSILHKTPNGAPRGSFGQREETSNARSAANTPARNTNPFPDLHPDFRSLHSFNIASPNMGRSSFGGLGEFRPDLGLNLGVGFRISADRQEAYIFAFKFDPNKESPAFLTHAVLDELKRFARPYFTQHAVCTFQEEVGSYVNNPRPWKAKN